VNSDRIVVFYDNKEGGWGGKANILGGYIIGNGKKNVYMNTRIILNGYRNRDVWNYIYRSIVYGNKQREISVYLILILYLNDRFVTVNNKFRKSYRQPQWNS